MTGPRIAVAFAAEGADAPLSHADLERLGLRCLELAGFEGRLSLAVIDDATMRDVNRDYHDCDEPTDVLAFPLREEGEGPRGPNEFDAEIVVSVETALREAAARGVEPAAELLLYVVHGVLHLVGYDDHDPDEAARMHAKSLEILGELGHENRVEV